MNQNCPDQTTHLDCLLAGDLFSIRAQREGNSTSRYNISADCKHVELLFFFIVHYTVLSLGQLSTHFTFQFELLCFYETFQLNRILARLMLGQPILCPQTSGADSLSVYDNM